MADSGFICSQASLQAGEPLLGTASESEVWLLLEYNGPWQSKAVDENELPVEIKAWLKGVSAAVPKSRQLLIRQPATQQLAALAHAAETGTANPDRKISCFICYAHPDRPRLFAYWLDSYSALLNIPIESIAAGEPLGGRELEGPLFLVCTNGRRDLCCARNGIPVYSALLERAALDGAGLRVWQTTHVGGHRFAANVLAFPHAIYYGRVLPEDTGRLYDAQCAGEILLELARGRAAYPEWVQAADLLLRQRLGERRLDGLHLTSVEEISPVRWNVSFSDRASQIHDLQVGVLPSSDEVYLGCGSEKTLPIIRYTLLE